MEKLNQEIIDTLNHLIAIAEDGKEGYKNAAADVKDIAIKNIFEKYSHQRESYISQLQQQVDKMGGSANNNGGPLGALHRALMDIKSVVTSGDAEAIINACVTGEEAAIKNYEDALKKDELTGSIRTLIQEQLYGIEEAINEIKAKVKVKVREVR